MTRLALFDCDGTLVDSQANIILCMEDAFERSGLAKPDANAVRRIVGLSLLPAVKRLMPDAATELQQQVAEDYKTAFHRLRGRGLVAEPLYPSIRELLDILVAQDWVLGVATGKSDRGLALCLEHHGIAHLFVTLQTADRHPSKPHPSMVIEAMAEAGARPETTIMIGDTSYDMAMGIAADARSIGVSWGYHGSDELIDAGAEAVVDDAAALLECLK